MTGPRQSPVVEAFVLGDFQTNCYLVRPDSDARCCWIVDVGFEPALMLDRAAELDVHAIVLTHCHVDHIAGLLSARRRLGNVAIWVHRAEKDWLNDPVLNLSAAMGLSITGPQPDRLLDGGERLELCGQRWHVRHTPGHSPGGIALLHEAGDQVIVGDTLFHGSIGRTDLPGADFHTLARSIRDSLYTLPDDVRVRPGHGPETTIGRERRSNPLVPG